MATLASSVASSVAVRRIALAGNPNAGKTTLFNALTGMRQKVGNYPGVTVEKKEGRCRLGNGVEVLILDLPGTYSLSPKSPDEEIARDVLLGLRVDTPVPDAVVVVVDASNLERNLYLATQVLELGIPTVVALNMGDVAKANGKPVDAQQLSQDLGAPVVELVAVRGEGLPQLRDLLTENIPAPKPPVLRLPEAVEQARTHLAQVIEPEVEGLAAAHGTTGARGIALRLLCSQVTPPAVRERFGPLVAEALDELRTQPALKPAVASAAEAQARYAMLSGVVERAVHQDDTFLHSFTDRADAILTHKVWGLLVFALITLLVFQAIYSWAAYPMTWIGNCVSGVSNQVIARMPDGSLRDLIVHGVIAGVGAVLTFLPQILILFFFIGLLEDSGYMARAAFLMDRLMARVGLHGRAFIPLMSSFACAIPGIMATRTISSRRDRMTTILIAPLMSCSARLPVYTLMIGTFIPNHKVFGFLSLRAAVMFSMYALGVAAAMGVAFVFKKTLFKGPAPVLMLELPPYKVPAWRNVLITMWERASQFLQRAGTVILAISIVLWFLLSYPKVDPNQVLAADSGSAAAQQLRARTADADQFAIHTSEELQQKMDSIKKANDEKIAAAQLRNSFAGYIGRGVEPFIAPLGFNWKIGIGLIGAMSAREVFVSTMGTVYSVGEADEDTQPLQQAMQGDRWPDGRPVWTTLVAVALLVYFVLAMQCMSTLAVVKRETNSWHWPLFMQVYLTAMAWTASFIVYQGGRLMGLG